MKFKTSIRVSRYAIATSIMVLAGGTAFAQTAAQTAPEQAAPQDETGNLGQDIVVTAQRRPEKLQQIPLAVTAFTEAAIKNLNLNDAISVSKYVPSMISQHNAGLATANSYFLRGLGNTQSAATFDAPVATYVDDIYVARQNANNYAYFDTERVEVLRGPQGTLFGKNTTGGAVSLIMRKPSDTYGGKFEGTYGSFGRVTAKASVDLPITDKILTKWSGFIVNDDGYLKNVTTGQTLNGEKNYGFRGDIRLLPTPDLTIDLSGEYTNNTGTYLGARSITQPSSTYRTTSTPVFYENATSMYKTSCKGDPVDILLSTGNGLCMNTDNYAGTAHVTWAPEAGTLEFIGGWRKMNQDYINNYTAGTSPTYAPVVANKYNGFILADKIQNNQFSGELKWNSEALDGKLKYVAGVFYLKETNFLDSYTFTGNTAGTSYLSNNGLPAAGVRFHQSIETIAAYAQGDYELVPNLTATVGARYTWEVKKLDFYKSDKFPGLGYDSADVLATGIPLRQSQSRVTPRVALSYKVNPNVLVFASATNGFKSGGWNGTNSNPALVLPFSPEKTWSFEGGFKSELFDRKLRLNGTFFYAATQDLQVTSGIVIVPGITSQLARNAGTLQSYGFEWETAYAPTKNLNIFVNGSVNHGEYLSTVLTPGVIAANQIQTYTIPLRVPKFQVASGATYKVPVDALHGSLGMTGTYRHNSSYAVAALNTAFAPEENFVDLTATYDDADGKWGASFGVTNLTKQETITANFISLFPGDPRRWTGRIWFNF
ncbi:MAG TPA: TonB-dependent receptor [Sphingobium sp.]|uniref:TonB-dependent receptor n=1 Tax=Sphingobium sp. TaxID=1912891 RepID=UPI002ED3D5DA